MSILFNEENRTITIHTLNTSYQMRIDEHGFLQHTYYGGRVREEDLSYLHLNYDDLAKRLGDLDNRGVVLRPGQNLKDIFYERLNLYNEYADEEIDETGLTIEQTVIKICKRASIYNYSQNTDLTNS